MAESEGPFVLGVDKIERGELAGPFSKGKKRGRLRQIEPDSQKYIGIAPVEARLMSQVEVDNIESGERHS